jgi:hypothetical protein
LNKLAMKESQPREFKMKNAEGRITKLSRSQTAMTSSWSPPGTLASYEEPARMGSICIVEASLSDAWLHAFAAASEPGISSLNPAVVTVTSFNEGTPQEDATVRSLLDKALMSGPNAERRRGRSLTCETVAGTIFPQSLWSPGVDRQRLYGRYKRLLPKLKKMAGNKRGLYFERLTAFGRGLHDGNQLEHIITCFQAGVKRTSAFQAALCDPERDLTTMPLQGFPCLQQIAVTPDRSSRTLAITGFYGTQYLFQRAYGNYLGLCRLGAFLAHEMGLRLTRMTCVASHATIGEGITKTAARRLVHNLREGIS